MRFRINRWSYKEWYDDEDPMQRLSSDRPAWIRDFLNQERTRPGALATSEIRRASMISRSAIDAYVRQNLGGGAGYNIPHPIVNKMYFEGEEYPQGTASRAPFGGGGGNVWASVTGSDWFKSPVSSIDPYRETMRELVRSADPLPSPVANMLQRDLTYMRRRYYGIPQEHFLDMDMGYNFPSLKRYFPGAKGTITAGDVARRLVQSQIGGFIALNAGAEYKSLQGNIPELINENVSAYMTSLVGDPRYNRQVRGSAPLGGLYAGYYGARSATRTAGETDYRFTAFEKALSSDPEYAQGILEEAVSALNEQYGGGYTTTSVLSGEHREQLGSYLMEKMGGYTGYEVPEPRGYVSGTSVYAQNEVVSTNLVNLDQEYYRREYEELWRPSTTHGYSQQYVGDSYLSGYDIRARALRAKGWALPGFVTPGESTRSPVMAFGDPTPLQSLSRRSSTSPLLHLQLARVAVASQGRDVSTEGFYLEDAQDEGLGRWDITGRAKQYLEQRSASWLYQSRIAGELARTGHIAGQSWNRFSRGVQSRIKALRMEVFRTGNVNLLWGRKSPDQILTDQAEANRLDALMKANATEYYQGRAAVEDYMASDARSGWMRKTFPMPRQSSSLATQRSPYAMPVLGRADTTFEEAGMPGFTPRINMPRGARAFSGALDDPNREVFVPGERQFEMQDYVPSAGGGGRRGSPPPPPPPIEPPEGDDFDLSGGDEGDPFEAIMRYRTPQGDALMGMLRAGRPALGALRPGWGKTDLIAGASVARGTGLSVLVTPQGSLNKQLVKRLQDYGIDAYNLIGHPGHGKDDTEYKAVHDEFFENVRGKTATGEWQGKSTVAVMSTEKFASLSGKRGLGAALTEFNERGFMKSIVFDEAQEILRGDRWMMKLLGEATEKFGGVPSLLLGGTVPEPHRAVLRSMFGIGSGDVVSAEPSLEHLNVSLRAANQEDYAKLGAEAAQNVVGGQFVYGYSTKLVEQMHQEATSKGRQGFMYHKGAGLTGQLSEADLRAAEQVFNTGTLGDQSVFASSAAGLGLDIGDIRSVVSVGATRMSDIVQRALRVRPARDPATGQQMLDTRVGSFELIADPEQYEKWASREFRNLEMMTPEVIGQAYGAAFAEDLPKNWMEAGQELSSRLGNIMANITGQENLRWTGGEALGVLAESGAVKLERVFDPESNEYYLNWRQTISGSPLDVANSIRNAEYRSEADPTRKLGFAEYRSEAADIAAREYRAIGNLTKQTSRLGPQEAGRYLKGAAGAFFQGGVGGLEKYTQEVLPQDLSNRYVQAVEQAVQQLQTQSERLGSVNAALDDYNQALGAAQKFIGESPVAAGQASFRLQQMGIAMEHAGDDLSARAFKEQAQFTQQLYMEGGSPPIAPSGGGGGRGGIFRGGLGSGLYAAYMTSRFWRMFAGDTLDRAEKFAGTEAAFAPIGTYGGEYGGFTEAQMYPSRMERFGYQMGAGAWDIFGGVMTSATRWSENPRNTRLAATVGVGAGVAAAGYILPSMMGMIPGLGGMSGAAAVTGPIGIAAGLGIGAYGLYRMAKTEREEMDAYIAQNPQEAALLRPSGDQYLEDMYANDRGPSGVLDFDRSASGRAYRSEYKEAYGRFDQWRKTRTPAGMASQIIKDYSLTNLQQEQLIPVISALQLAAGQAMAPGGQLYQQVGQISQIAAQEGIAPEQLVSAGLSYAGSTGALPGTSGMVSGVMGYAQMSPYDRQLAEEQASRLEGFAAQLTQYMGGRDALGTVRKYGLDSATPIGELRTVSALYERYFGKPQKPIQIGAGLTLRPGLSSDDLAELAQLTSPAGTQSITGWIGKLAEAGAVTSPADFEQLYQSYASATQGFTPHQYAISDAIMGGDLKAMSFASYNMPQTLNALGMSTAAGRWYDRSGRPIYQTSGRDFAMLTQAWAPKLQAAAQSPWVNFQSAGDVSAGLGVSQGMGTAVWEGGLQGAQLYTAQRMRDLQLAGIGNQMAQINATEQYLWGGGGWTGQPAQGSMWWYQDRMNALQHKATMRQFRFGMERMETQNEFAIQQEGISLQRMDTTQDFQRWQFGFQRAGMELQQQWTRKDWQFQDKTRALTWGWQMEDMEEGIRFSSGRERKQLVRQRERTTLMHNLEEGQIDEQRDRQEQLWAREEERFEKQKEYAEELMGLDREQYDLNVEQRETFFEMDMENMKKKLEEYQKQHKLELKMQEASRDHQAVMLELQKAALGIQAAQVVTQQEMEKVVEESERHWVGMKGEMEMINEYTNVPAVLRNLTLMATAMNQISVSKIYQIRRLMEALQ